MAKTDTKPKSNPPQNQRESLPKSSKLELKGITAKKDEDFSEWYTQVIQKADLAEYSAVSGCIVYKPNSYSIWEKIQKEVDHRFKAVGIKNAYFPLFIPESLLQKESVHIKGFAPEVAWVTEAGNNKLSERLAVRPTSETIMYDSYSKWIRSYKDLPLRINQWNSVVRWEFKHPTPFLRGREFLWNEGHTVFATREEAEAEGEEIIGIYDEVCRKYLALPSLIGKKSEKEKFAGAEYTVSMEFIMPNGKAIQGPDFHHDGQIFSKAFGISFTNEKGGREFAWQNTFAITTRMIGVLVAIHSDDKGLVLPPKVAPIQAVIVPILFDDSKAKVLAEAEKIKNELSGKGILVHLDNREGYTPGWKFNDWELKGVPVRIEIGPKDLEKKQVMVARRDDGTKSPVEINKIGSAIVNLLEQVQTGLFLKATTVLKESLISVDSLSEAKKQLDNKKVIFAPFCGLSKCEEKFKEETGAKSLNGPLEQPKLKKGQKCFNCDSLAKSWFYFGKSY